MKVVELFAALGVKPDSRSFDQARKQLERFHQRIERDTRGWSQRIGRALVGAQTRMVAGARALGGAARTMGGSLGGLGGVLGVNPAAVAGLVGVGSAAAATRDAFAFDDALTTLDISSQGAMGSLSAVRQQILAISRDTGVAKEELLAGAAAFVALTGDGKGATEGLQTFARVQRATGAAMEDIAASAAALSQQMGIAPAQFEQAFSALVKGGKMGAVELRDLASLMASLGPQFTLFKGSQGISGMAQLAAGLQLTRQGFGSAAEAATGMKALMTALISKSSVLQKVGGIRVFDTDERGEKTARNLVELVEEIGNSKLAKDPALLSKALGSDEALKAFLAITRNRDAFRELSRATLNATDVADDFAKRQSSASARAAKSWNQVKVAVAEAFSPATLENFASGLEVIIERETQFARGLDAMAGRFREAGGGKLMRDTEAQQRDALRLFQEKTGFSSEFISRMTPEEIMAHAGRRGIGKQLLDFDILGNVSRGGTAFGIAEAARRSVEEEESLARLRAGVLDDRFPIPTFRFDQQPSIGDITVNVEATAPAGADASIFASTIGRVVREALHGELRHALASTGGGR